MINDLINKVDEKTTKKIKQLNYIPKLLTVNLDNSKPNNIYEKSLKRKGKELGIEVMDIHFHELNKEEYKDEKVLLLKPCDKAYRNLYEYILFNLKRRSVEPKGIQIPTIKAITDVVNEIGSKQNIMIIGRSKELGRPLAEKLLDHDHTVMITHTKTNLLHAKYWDTIINLAALQYVGVEAAFLIDVSGKVKASECDWLVSDVGRLTTSYALNRAIIKKECLK